MARRAGRGYTKEPWPCCGEKPGEYGRPKVGVCGECSKLIAEGKAARAKAEAERQAGEVQPYHYNERPYAAPGYYGLGIPGIDYSTEERVDLMANLRDAQFELVHAVSLPATPTTPARPGNPKAWKNTETWPHVFSVKCDKHDWAILVLMRPAVREAVDRFDQAARAAIAAAYANGKRDGHSLLMRLASGDMAMADFDRTIKRDSE